MLNYLFISIITAIIIIKQKTVGIILIQKCLFVLILSHDHYPRSSKEN